jgi:type IV pilus assembly protein PilN
LNAVFAWKSFSWTAVMMDLEKVLPAGVQVTSIEPNIAKDGEVNIRLRVSGDRDRAVQLVRNLETSQRFLSPRLSSEQAQTQEGANRASSAAQMVVPGAVQFEILSGYNPLPTKPILVKDKDVEGDEPKVTAPKRVARPKTLSPSPRPGVVKAPMQKGAPR